MVEVKRRVLFACTPATLTFAPPTYRQGFYP